jgi:hypothetical protein
MFDVRFGAAVSQGFCSGFFSSLKVAPALWPIE